MKIIIATALLLLCSQAQALIIYDVSFTGINTGAGSGGGTVGFNDDALDTDGVFDTSSAIASFDISVDGFQFNITDLLLSPQINYEVQGGLLVGFDWRADSQVGSLSGGLLSTTEAGSLGLPVNLFSQFAPCQAGQCEYSQTWALGGTGLALPEPGSLLLVGVGLMGLGLRRSM